MLNDPYSPGVVRTPRLRVLHAGAEIGGALAFNIHSNSYYQADTFTCSFAFNATVETPLAFWGDPAWDQEHPLLLDVQASVDGGVTYSSLLIGSVDHMTVYLEKGIIEVEGRDRAAVFIDARTNETFQNRTASQVVETLAARHGLQADVTPTTKLVGRYYEIDHEQIGAAVATRTTTEWNLICHLAAREKYDVWVTGNTIHFHPQSDSGQDPYLVVFDRQTPRSNVMSLSAERSLSFSKDVTVIVQSLNSRHGQSYSAHSGRSNAPASNTFIYTLANLDKAGCQEAANRIRAQLSQHERLIGFEIPGELSLTPRTPVRVTGTASGWDDVGYRIDAITRTMSFGGGFSQRVQVKSMPVST